MHRGAVRYVRAVYKICLSVFDGNRRIISRLTMTEFDDTVPYLRSLYALGSSNRIQVTLKTDDENYINPRGVGLDRGGVNIRLAFSDGNTTEFAPKTQTTTISKAA